MTGTGEEKEDSTQVELEQVELSESFPKKMVAADFDNMSQSCVTLLRPL